MELIAEKVITQTKKHPQIEPLLTTIAQKYLRVETLQTQHSDSADFHNVSVWELRAALEAAFQAGTQLGASVAAHMDNFVATELDRLNAHSD